MVLYCCGDLLWASKIKSTGEAVGVACRPVRNGEMLSARLADSPARAVMVDLTSEHCWALMDLLRGAAATEQARGLSVVCFGPHGDVDALRKAGEMGANAVMSRGALSGNLPEVLKSLDAGLGAESSTDE